MKNLFSKAGIAVCGAVLATGVALAGCGAAAPAVQSRSDGAIYLMNGDTGIQYDPASALEWNVSTSAVLSSVPVPTLPTDFEPLRLPPPGQDAVDWVSFISAVGSERDRSAWKSWGDTVPLDGKGPLLPTVFPGYLGNGEPKAVQTSGGTFSMGVAYLSSGDLRVVSAYFTTIQVTAGSGTWTFITPKPTTEATK